MQIHFYELKEIIFGCVYFYRITIDKNFIIRENSTNSFSHVTPIQIFLKLCILKASLKLQCVHLRYRSKSRDVLVLWREDHCWSRNRIWLVAYNQLPVFEIRKLLVMYQIHS